MKQILEWDAILSAKLRMSQTSPWWKLIAFLAHSGDSWFWMVGLIILWLVGDQHWHKTGALMAAGVGGLAVFVLAVKFTIRRQRPPGDWGAIYRNTDPHSFPSGHAARAGLLASMAMGLGPLWFGILLMLWAPLVSISRVATGVHYLSDIIVGLILGLGAGAVVLAITPWIMQTFYFIF
jgi:undecaprenyl-diphosphatase